MVKFSSSAQTAMLKGELVVGHYARESGGEKNG